MEIQDVLGREFSLKAILQVVHLFRGSLGLQLYLLGIALFRA